MAVKTITIDLTAYNLLAWHKRAGQSFSEVIKEHFRPVPTAATFKQLLRSARVHESTIDGLDAQVRTRRTSPARAVKL
jgi:hypothetical protein